MATSDDLAQRVDDITTCPVCLEVFKTPKCLPCIHTFCLQCLERHFETTSTGDEISCPMCRQDCPVPAEGLHKLPLNFFIQNLIDAKSNNSVDAKSERSDISLLCEACSSDNDVETGEKATVYCVECSQNLCERCSVPHTKMRGGPHQILQLGDELMMHLAQKRDSYCEKHSDKLVELHCFDCKINICMMCCLVGHKQHESQEISKVAGEFLKQIKSDMQAIAARILVVREKGVLLESEKSKFFDKINDLNLQVMTKQKRDSHANKANGYLESIKSKTLKEIEIRKDRITIALLAMESFNAYCEQLTTKGRPIDITHAVHGLHIRATELLQTADIMEDYCIPPLNFQPSDLEEFNVLGQTPIGIVKPKDPDSPDRPNPTRVDKPKLTGDAQKYLRMVTDAVETYSYKRGEKYASKLIDLINSDDFRQFMNEKNEPLVNKLNLVEKQLGVSLYGSLRLIRELASDKELLLLCTHDTMAGFSEVTENLQYMLTSIAMVLNNKHLTQNEKFRTIWDGVSQRVPQSETEEVFRDRFNNLLSSWEKEQSKKQDMSKSEIKDRKMQLKKDFEISLKESQASVEALVDTLREDLTGLQFELSKHKPSGANKRGPFALPRRSADNMTSNDTSQENEMDSSATELFVQRSQFGAAKKSLPELGTTSRTANVRKAATPVDPSWYPRIQESILDYVRGRTTDDDLRKLIKNEHLEDDREIIRKYVQKWITRMRSFTQKTKASKLNKEALICDMERVWAFTKALLLDDENVIKQHSEILAKLVRTAVGAAADVAPVLSIGRLSDDSKLLKLELLAAQNASKEDVDKLMHNLSQVAGVVGVNASSAADGRCSFELQLDDDVQRVAKRLFGDIVDRVSQAAELHVRLIMIGEYQISGGSRLTNPSFNRIYGQGLEAPGFRPTVFGYLEYSGEKYYCPSGWRRISINVAPSAEEFDRRYAGWHVAYHGTKHELAAAILTSGFLPSRPTGAYCGNDGVVYFSPSIVYASHPRYAEVCCVEDKGKKKQYMQMVLQVRVNPLHVWKKEGGGVNGAYSRGHPSYRRERDSTAVDPNFPKNKNLEWLVKPVTVASGTHVFGQQFVIYGIMIRVYSTDPNALPENAWWHC